MMASGSANCAISQVSRSAISGAWSQSGLLTICARSVRALSLNFLTSSARSAAFCLSAGVINCSTAAIRSSRP